MIVSGRSKRAFPLSSGATTRYTGQWFSPASALCQYPVLHLLLLAASRLRLALFPPGKGWRRWPVFLLLASLPASLPGAETEVSGQYAFDSFGMEMGLPQTNVTASLQTRDGYLWVGTEGGLARFDGVRFTTFRKSNTPAFIDHSVNCLFEDRAGGLWIGMEKGLIRYRRGAFERIGFEDTAVNAVAEDRAGRIWIGTTKGLSAYQNGRLTDYGREPAMPSRSVRCLFVDSTDRLWLGFMGGSGVVCKEGENFRYYNGGGEMDRDTFAICELPQGTFWFATNHGVYRLQHDVLDRFTKTSGLISIQVGGIQPARGGGLWVVDGAVQRVTDLKRFTIETVSNMPSRNIRHVFEDSEGSLWLSAMSNGLIRMHQTQYRSMPVFADLPDDVVKSVTQDRDGYTWAATYDGGVLRIAPDGRVQHYTEEDGLASRFPLTIYGASDGTVWIGFARDLCIWKDGKIQTDHDIRSTHAIMEDKRGNVWFGTDERLMRRSQDGKFEEIQFHGQPIKSVQAFAEDRSGEIYFGTVQGELYVFSEGSIASLKAKGREPVGSVRALFVDHADRLWVGMKDIGLGLFMDGRWFATEALAASVADHVSAITEDDTGRLWLGTPAGIIWANEDELIAAAQGTVRAPALHNASIGDDYRFNPVSSGTQPVVWKARDGGLWFATRHGLLAIDPRHVSINRAIPPVHIEDVTVDGQQMNPTEPVTVPAGARELVINYTAPSFVQPSRVFFQYRLEGYDTDWVQAQTRRTAFYHNLPPGRYAFQVKACNSDGLWNEQGDSVAVIQEPHFYQTWWFYGLALAGVVGAGVGLNRWSHRQLAFRLERLEQRQAMEKERRRIAKNLHDDLGASLTEIGFFAETARRKTALPETGEALTFLSERVRGLAGSLDAVVWTVNPANDYLEQLVAYLAEMFQDFLRLGSIRCRLEVTGDFPSILLSPEARSNLFLAAREATNNIIKHSGATEAWLRMRMDQDLFLLSIEDDGCGFDASNPRNAGRNGLANMRSRIEELKGKFSLESAPGRGTRISISVRFAGENGARKETHSRANGGMP